MASTKARLAEAIRLFQRGEISAARNILEAISQSAPADCETWHWFAVVLARLREFPAARAAIEKALSIGPASGTLLLLASNICQDLGDIDSALRYAEQSERMDPSFAAGINNLGILLGDRNQLDQSIAAFERAIAVKPDYPRAVANLAATLLRVERFQEALVAATRSVGMQSSYAHGHYMRAAALFHLGDSEAALKACERALQLEARLGDAWLLVAKIHRQRHAIEQTSAAAKHAYALMPDRIEPKLILADLTWIGGNYSEAEAMWREILALQPQQLEAAIRLATSVQGIYADRSEIDRARDKIELALHQLLAQAGRYSQATTREVLRDLQTSNFFLAYQGRDDLVLQKQYAAFIESVLRAHVPQYYEPIESSDCCARPIRIGFASRFLFRSTAGNYFASWLTDLPQDRFEVYAFYTGELEDDLTEAVKQRAKSFFHQNVPFDRLADEIRGATLDVLLYPELGMDGTMYALASLRLAPIQICGWGHPVTSGHRNIDYFFSCELMEPQHAQQHYAEKLRLLPGLGTRYEKPVFPDATSGMAVKHRMDFQLPPDKTLYLLPQSLFKIHPDNDDLITEILLRDAEGVLVMFAANYPSWTSRFVQRLETSFRKKGMNTHRRVKILPILSHPDYKRVNQLADVMIDTLYWSGGNTSLDALAMGLPIVTLPGEFMRGRQSAAMLKMLGLDELIASDKTHYLDIALRLGQDKVYRQVIRDAIRANDHLLFDDPAPTKAFAELVESLVRTSAKSHSSAD
jgi:protein O-GlcNAc transferase